MEWLFTWFDALALWALGQPVSVRVLLGGIVLGLGYAAFLWTLRVLVDPVLPPPPRAPRDSRLRRLAALRVRQPGRRLQG